MKNPHDIIVKPHITEKSMALAYGDERGAKQRLVNEARAKSPDNKAKTVQVKDEDLVRKYTFIVARDANKIEIKSAIEYIFNLDKKVADKIEVTSVRTIKVLGKARRRGQRKPGYEPDRKKAVITLKQGQSLEDYGV